VSRSANTVNPAGRRIERWRIWVFAVCTLALIGAAVGYDVSSARGHASVAASRVGADAVKTLPLSAPGAPRVLYVDTQIGPDQGRLAEVPLADPGASPELGAPECERSYSAGGTLVCLNLAGSALTTSLHLEVYDSGAPTARPARALTITGTPSRARVSADGKLVAWTVFVSGDSYNGPNFSTRTGILNVRTGALVENLETFNAYVDGRLYRSVDINYWGVTFAADDNTFYATMGSKGKTWLMRGNLATHELTSVVENAECPSLSPDGTRVVFKKRIGTSLAAPWRFYVLDLATGREKPLAETRSVDDQAAWLDDDTVMYAVPHTDGTGYDIWEVPADGTGKPTLLIRDGSSPSVIE
jgi:WD40-like Beta Propeller Repeat